MVAPKIEFCTHCGYDLPPEKEPPDSPREKARPVNPERSAPSRPAGS
jgi:hypothetical protein